jgi:hypothetical protein
MVDRPDADSTDDYPDMMETADMLLEDNGSGKFAFGCLTGQSSPAAKLTSSTAERLLQQPARACSDLMGSDRPSESLFWSTFDPTTGSTHRNVL